MDVYAVLDQVVALLQQRGRVTYNALKLQFTLDDDQMAVLTDELLYAHRQVVEDAGRGLCWTGDTAAPPAPALPVLQPAQPPVSQAEPMPQGGVPMPKSFPTNTGDLKKDAAARKQWLQDNAESYRIQQLVPVRASKE